MKKWLFLFTTCLAAQVPPGGPILEEGSPLFITADFTYWTARQGGLGFAYSGVNSTQKHGKFHQINFHSQPGFKVGAGARINRDGWDFYAQYTWHHNDPKRETVTPAAKKGQLTPSPLVAPDNAFLPLSLASAQWKLTFNALDLEVGRNSQLGEYLKVRPFIGFKGSWQEQTFDADIVPTFTTHQEQDYWGFGIRTGLNTAWHFSDMWSIFTDVALSGLWSHFETNRKDTLFLTRSDIYTLKGVFEWDIGLRWEKTWTRYHLAFQAGWELQLWENHNHFIYVASQMDGDLVLQGLTIHARFDF